MSEGDGKLPLQRDRPSVVPRPMRMTRSEVADKIEAVINGRLSRLDADHWFIEMMDTDARGMLAFEPVEDEARIREGLWSLQAIDHRRVWKLPRI